MRELDLQEFVDEIYEDYNKNDDTEYIFFLGAGCSKSSGIKLAGELAKEWYEELRKQRTKFDKFNENKIDDISNINYGKYYFEIFEELFPTPLMQQKEIQRITNADEVNPSLGYYILASLLQRPQFNTIVTTNFDNLIQDALIYSGNKRALVITHQDLAKFIKRDNTPLITKIHGDAHMQPFNNSDDTKKIPEELKGAIQGLFTNAKVIFIGYSGNDESIADLLEGCNRIDQVYWLNTSEPNDVSLSNWWKNIPIKTFINEYDFDKIMNVIKSKFNIEKPDFQKRALELEQGYNCSVKEEIKEIENIEEKDKTYLDYILLGNSYLEQNKYDKAIKYYKSAININPKDDVGYVNLGLAYEEIDANKEAIKLYLKAIKINSNRDQTYYNIGIAYGKEKDYENAIKSYQKAIEINPKKVEAYNNMGNIFLEINKFEKTIEIFLQAIEINPKRADTYYNLGIAYLKLKSYKNAIEAYRKVLEINNKDYEAYIGLFIISLINNIVFDKELELKYIEIFKEEEDVFVQYEMLKILSNINQSEDVDLSIWQEKYKEQNLTAWSFDELDDWMNKKESPKKEKLLEAIEVFKRKVI